MSTPEPASPVLVHRTGRLGHVELNRPRAINALTHEMVDLIAAALTAWADDPAITTVLLTGAGERGLCAGGDMVTLWYDARAGGSAAAEFWAAEYRLNALIAAYPKPFVAVMDGIVLGGGIGLSAHANLRIVTERSTVGMPETGIGFLPDVGGTFLLSRGDDERGTHLALTAGLIGAGDAIDLGLADVFVPGDRLGDLAERLIDTEAAAVVQSLAAPAPEAALLADLDWINRCYAGDDLVAIVDRLTSAPNPAAREAAATIAAKSPTACAVTLAALRQARGFVHLQQSLDLEFNLACRLFATHDATEGIRAQLVDKDRQPRWDPPTIADLPPVPLP